jgi:hypothetical protein
VAASINDAQTDIDIIKANAPVKNILDLGADNTGNADVSTIINNNTESYTLFFPVGKYLISQPITIKNGIYGATNSPGTYDNDNKTIFVSGLTANGGLIISNKEYNTIENISIICNGKTTSAISTTGVVGTIAINNVCIEKLQGTTAAPAIGIHISSGRAYMNNLTIFGLDSDGLDKSITCGIKIDSNDCRITNIGIFKC